VPSTYNSHGRGWTAVAAVITCPIVEISHAKVGIWTTGVVLRIYRRGIKKGNYCK
jgi:hypothetical protein